MGKRAFFVLGAEGSGTNLLAEALVSAGCHYNPEHNSHLDDYRFEEMSGPFVFRRSLPHAGKWPNIMYIAHHMAYAGYNVKRLIIIRDFKCTVLSVHRRDPLREIEDIKVNVFKAMKLFGQSLLYSPTIISYEALCLDLEYRRWLFVERLGLKEPTIEINYANPKYYGG